MTDQFVAEIRLFAGSFAPTGWAFCNGRLLNISQNTALFSLLGTFYGGDGRTTFALPNLQGRVPIHAGQGPGLNDRRLGVPGGSATVNLKPKHIPVHTHPAASTAATTDNPTGGIPAAGGNCSPPGALQGGTTAQQHAAVSRAHLHHCLAGHLPPEGLSAMSTPFLAEIRLFTFGFVPRGWAMCAGQLLPINQNQALFSLLGTTYGGDGRVNFALPNLQGRLPVGAGLTIALGEAGGEISHTLTPAEAPQHGVGVGKPPTTHNPLGATPARNGDYSETPTQQTGSVGNGQPHENRPPYLALTYAIAMQGIYPSQELERPAMGEPYIGEIRIFGGSFAPAGWAFCDGSVMPISENETLSTSSARRMAGTGRRRCPPRPQRTSPLGTGSGGGVSYQLAEFGGVETVTLTVVQIPPHGIPTASTASTSKRPKAALAVGGSYAPLAAANGRQRPVGKSQPHGNMPPFLPLSFIICLFGIFPSPA